MRITCSDTEACRQLLEHVEPFVVATVLGVLLLAVGWQAYLLHRRAEQSPSDGGEATPHR